MWVIEGLSGVVQTIIVFCDQDMSAHGPSRLESFPPALAEPGIDAADTTDPQPAIRNLAASCFI